MDSWKDMNRTTRELAAELNRINNELESLAEQVQKDQRDLRGSLFWLMLFFVFYWAVGIYFWDRPVSDVRFTAGPEVSIVVGIGLFIGIPIFYVRSKQRINTLVMRKSELEGRKQQLEEILGMRK